MSASEEQELEALIQFIYMAPIGLAQTDLAGEIAMVNPLCAQLLMPLSPAGAMTNLFEALEGVMPDLRHRVETFKPSHGLVCDSVRFPVRRPDGRKSEAKLLSLSVLKLDADRMMAVLSDVTRAERQERELRENQAWFNAIVTGVSGYALLQLDANGHIADWNEGVERLTGHQRDIIGSSFATFSPTGTSTPERQMDRLHEADDNGWSLQEGWCCRADGSQFWSSHLIAPLKKVQPSNHLAGTAEADCMLSDGPAYSLIIRDISDKRESHEALQRALSCDHLTGLLNRRTFFESAELEFQRWHRHRHPLSMIIFDADHFKAINDRFGHPAGDKVLIHFAQNLASSFRAIDVVARMGGEEFIVLLPGTDLGGALVVAKRICAQISDQHVTTEGADIHYSVSAGVTTMDGSIPDLDTLVKRADLALYAAKANGRNRVESWKPESPKSIAAPPAEVAAR